ncbi:general stress protein [Paenibacillus sp. CC-CFT747]|nr:general stress protein [Paenibacillus sp. CC-CFT747]
MNRTTAGVYLEEEAAVNAIEELKKAGYGEESITVVTKDKRALEELEETTGAQTPDGLSGGSVTGGVIGGAAGLFVSLSSLAVPGVGPLLVAGALAATAAGAAIGASAGGYTGTLTELGLNEDEAKRYDDDLRDGKVLVLVHAEEGEESEAARVLHR